MSGYRYDNRPMIITMSIACLLAAPIIFTYPVELFIRYAVPHLTPDRTQACWEAGSAMFSLMNLRAIRKSRAISGIHWLPTAFFALWGIYNLWFYAALNLPLAWWAGMLITLTNLIWLGHVCYYALTEGKSK